MMARLLACLLLAPLATPLFAVEPAGLPPGSLQGAESMARLPASGFLVVNKGGKLLLMSTNGHFVIEPKRILDVWNRIEVTSVADVEQTHRIPIEHPAFRPDELGAYTTGQGPTVWVWIDALNRDTSKILAQIRQLSASYTFNVAFLPAQPDRKDANRALTCSRDSAGAFVEQGVSPGAAPSSCGLAELDKTMVVAHLLGVQQVPFTIAPNGRTLVGVPPDYAGFLSANVE